MNQSYQRLRSKISVSGQYGYVMALKFALYPGCAAKGATPELYQSTMAIVGRSALKWSSWLHRPVAVPGW